MVHMFVQIDDFVIEHTELTKVYGRGIGFPGFEFEGVAPEEKGKRIVEKLEQLKGQKYLDCKAIDDQGREYSGYGTLEEFKSEYVTKEAPVMYRFSGTVSFAK